MRIAIVPQKIYDNAIEEWQSNAVPVKLPDHIIRDMVALADLTSRDLTLAPRYYVLEFLSLSEDIVMVDIIIK